MPWITTLDQPHLDFASLCWSDSATLLRGVGRDFLASVDVVERRVRIRKLHDNVKEIYVTASLQRCVSFVEGAWRTTELLNAWEFGEMRPQRLVFSATGDCVLMTHEDGLTHSVHRFDDGHVAYDSFAAIQPNDARKLALTSCALFVDGARLACVEADASGPPGSRCIVVRQTSDWTPLAGTSPIVHSQCDVVAVSPDGATLYCCRLEDNEVFAWNVADGRPRPPMPMTNARVHLTYICVSPDGRWLVACSSRNNSLAIFSTTSGSLRSAMPPMEHQLCKLAAFSRCGAFVASCSTKSLCVWNSATSSRLYFFNFDKLYYAVTMALAFADDASVVVVVDMGNERLVVDTRALRSIVGPQVIAIAALPEIARSAPYVSTGALDALSRDTLHAFLRELAARYGA